MFRTLAALFLASCLYAQTNNGRISGTVSDSSGAVIPGANVIVKSQDTGLTWKAATDDKGFYVVTNLPVGAFSVEIDSAGFRRSEKTGYDLADGGRISADFKLEVGAMTDSIVVTETLGETVNTTSGEIGRVIDSEQVQDLALNGRNYMQLVSLIPGVALLDEDQMALTTSLSVTNQSVNGNRTGSNHLMVDGGTNLDSGSNGSQVNNVGVDFIQQVKVQTSGFSAEYGRNSGASINVVTRSGTSKYHGGGLWTLRNDYFDAKDYFAPTKPILRFNDYGWNVGGPVGAGKLRNRLFFFAGEEWKRITRYTSPSRKTLPTLQELTGDFSDRTTAIYYPGTKTPVPNKDLAPLMTTDGKAVMNVYKTMIPMAALYLNTPTSNNATYQVLEPFRWRQDIARMDYRASDRHNIYFRWMHDHYDLVNAFGTFNASALPNTPTARNRPGYGPQLSETWTVSPRLLNEAKINTSWNGQRTPLQGDNWKRSTFGFQFPLIFGGNGPVQGSIPDVSVSSFTGYNGGTRVYLMSPVTDITISDALTWVRNEHTVKTGISIIRNRKDQNGRTTYAGTVAFNPSNNTQTTNYSLADAAVGQFQTYGESSADPVGFFRFSQYEGFVQDSWRVSKRLSFEIGFRFSHFVPTYTSANNIVNFVPWLYNPAKAVTVLSNGTIVAGSGNPLNGLIRAGNGIPADQIGRVSNANSPEVLAVPTGAPRGLYKPGNLVMPRFSFAWQPFGNAKTAVRGGFGSFHDRVQGNVIFSQLNIAPFSKQVTYESGNLSDPLAGTASALAVMGGINAMDPNLKTPVVYTFNFGISRELPWGTYLDVTYSGNQTRHLLRQPDINYPTFAQMSANNAIPSSQRPQTNAIRPYKGFSTIRYYMSDANSNYNALQTYFTKRKGNSNFTVSYTWSHTLADAGGDTDNPDSGLEYANRHFYYGPPSFDRRHIFVATYTYRVPFFRRSKGIVGATLGRWEVSGITRKQSGPHLTPTGNSILTRRADYLGGDVQLSDPSPNLWFNKAAFKAAPTDRLGNAGTGIIVGPGLYLWDLTLRKEFAVAEGGRVRVRFEAQTFNLMNHPNYRSLNTTTTDSAFATVSASGPARNIQFGLKLSF